MNLYIGQMVYLKQTARDTEQKFGFVSAINNNAANIAVISNGTMTMLRNVTIAENAETAQPGECYAPELPETK